MECTSRYHEPMVKALSEAGLFISVVNPHLIKNFGSNSLRKVKSDPADAKKTARYTLDNRAELRQLRKLVEERADADFIIMNGNRALINRKLFEKCLDESASV